MEKTDKEKINNKLEMNNIAKRFNSIKNHICAQIIRIKNIKNTLVKIPYGLNSVINCRIYVNYEYVKRRKKNPLEH